MDPNMYFMYNSIIKGPHLLISGIRERYVAHTTQIKLVSPIEQLEQTQYPIKIPTFGLKQLFLIPRNIHVQLIMTTTLHINIFVANGLHVHGNDVLFEQLKRSNSHPQPSGEPHGGSPRGGGSPNQDPLERLLLDPPIQFYGWSILHSRMFLPSWCPSVVIQSKPTNKQPYQKKNIQHT
jgi:hypothetical protein